MRKIENSLNQKMSEISKSIYGEKIIAPELDLKNGNSYSLKTPNDEGTGTAEKSMIFFDMSVLELTCLPAVAHDTVVFANLDSTYLKPIIFFVQPNKKTGFYIF